MAEKVVFPSFRDDNFTGFDMRQLVSALEYRFTSIETELTETTVASGGPFAPLVHQHVESDITDLQAYLLNINSESIFDLADVSGTPAVNNVLRWNGSAFVPASVGATINLNDLANVSVPAPSNGDHLVYNSSSGVWASSAASATFNTDLTGQDEYDLLYNDGGTTWHDTAGELTWNPDLDYLQLANAHSINWRNASFVSVQLLDFDATNAFLIGDSSYVTTLRGSEINATDVLTGIWRFEDMHVLTDIVTATPPTTEAVTGFIGIYDLDDTDNLAFFGFNGSNELLLRNEMRGGNLTLSATTAAGVDQPGFTYRPDTDTRIFHKDGVRLVTQDAGNLWIASDVDTATPPTTEAVFVGFSMVDDGLNDFLMQLAFSGNNFLQLKNQMHSGHIWLTAEDVSGVEQLMFDLDPDLGVVSAQDFYLSGTVRVSDAGLTDYIDMSHDGTNFSFAATNTANVLFSGATSDYIFNQDGSANVRIGGDGSGDTNNLYIGKGFDVASGITWVRSATNNDASIYVDASEQLNISLDHSNTLAGDVDLLLRHNSTLFWRINHDGTDTNWTFSASADVNISGLSRINLFGGASFEIWDSTNTDRIDLSHDGTDANIAFSGTDDVNFTGSNRYLFNQEVISTGGGLAAFNSYSDPNIAGTAAFIDVNGGIARFGAYDYSLAAWQSVNMQGSTVETSTTSGAIVLDSAEDVDIEYATGRAFTVSENATVRFMVDDSTNLVWVRDGFALRISDSADTDYVEFSHDGTDLNIVGTNTSEINISPGAIASSAYARVSTGAQTLSILAGTTGDHCYMGWYADSAAQGTRSAYLGYGSAGTDNMDLVNEQGNGNINIQPSGTGNVILGNYTLDGDQTVGAGQDNYVLTYDNGSGLISLEAAAVGGGGLNNIVEDTTPQLGGDLDMNGFEITNGFAVDHSGQHLFDVTTASGAANSTDGWIRIATADSSTGRGGCYIWVSNAGGNGAPDAMLMSVSGTYNSAVPNVTVLSRQQGSITAIRAGFDTTDSKKYIDIEVANGLDATYYVQVSSFAFSGTGYVAELTTAPSPATPSSVYEITLNNAVASIEDLAFGAFSGQGGGFMGFYTAISSSLVIENDDGDAAIYLKADTSNTVETSNPFIRFEQEGNAVSSIIGPVGLANVDAEGNTFTGMANNGYAIHHNFATGEIGLGVNQNCPVVINDSDQFIVKHPSSGDSVQMSHNGTDLTFNYTATTWHRFTSIGSGWLFQDGGEMRIYDTTDADYLSLQNDGSNAFISTNSSTGNFHLRINGSENSIVMQKNAGVTMYYDNTDAFRVKASGSVQGDICHASVRTNDGLYLEIGYGTLYDQGGNASLTVDRNDAGRILRKTTGTARTYTLTSSFPVGGTIQGINAVTSGTGGNITINASTNTQTLYWYDGSTRTGGASTNRTVGPGGVFTLYYVGSSVWEMWGSGIS